MQQVFAVLQSNPSLKAEQTSHAPKEQTCAVPGQSVAVVQVQTPPLQPPLGQRTPHAPQLAGSLLVSSHTDEQHWPTEQSEFAPQLVRQPLALQL